MPENTDLSFNNFLNEISKIKNLERRVIGINVKDLERNGTE